MDEETAVPNGSGRHRLSDKQRLFFQRQRQAITQIEMAMRGALQLVVEEKELAGKVTLSEDCSELIEEERRS